MTVELVDKSGFTGRHSLAGKGPGFKPRRRQEILTPVLNGKHAVDIL